MINKFKARTNFGDVTDGDVSKLAHNTQVKMLANAVTFTTPPLTMAAYLLIIGAYDQALAKSVGGSTAGTVAKNDARVTLEGAMRNLGHYVNIVAQGNQATIELSGFPTYSTAHVQPEDKGMVSNVTFIPQNFRMMHGGTSGTIKFRWHGDGSRTGCELQTNITDQPSNDAAYTYAGSVLGGKAELGGFVPGTTVWGRVRKIGRHGETGPWSDPAKLMVL
jgi:hypothetical protein